MRRSWRPYCGSGLLSKGGASDTLRFMGDALIEIDQAYPVLFSHVRAGPVENMLLQESLYRTLAEPIRCDLDDPPFDRAVMDGYAVRAADVASAGVTLRVVGQVAAGAVPVCPLRSGEAVQINTGAPIPRGADAVVRVELTALNKSGKEVVIEEAGGAGQFIIRRGTYAQAGQTVLREGTRLGPLEIATAATAGAGQVTVYRQPTVAVLATGDELIDIDHVPAGAQIRNSNGYLLRALIEATRAAPTWLGVASDDRSVLRRKVLEAMRFDVLCITGGVSMGAFDFVPEVLDECGATFHIRKVAIKPGRPTIFATMPNGMLVFALPGNPISAFVAFELLVRPAIAALEGRPWTVPVPMKATLRGDVKPTSNRQSYQPARARVGADGQWEVETLSWHGSGDAVGTATANAMIVRPVGAVAAHNGDAVSILVLDSA